VARKVTLVSSKLAQKGIVFVPEELNNCKKCKYFRLCIGNVRTGLPYKIVAVRNIAHRCPATNTIMKIVFVEPAPFKILILSKVAYEGAVIKYRPLFCEQKCKFKKLCQPKGLKEGDKIKILSVKSKSFRCPKGYYLTLVEAFLP